MEVWPSQCLLLISKHEEFYMWNKVFYQANTPISDCGYREQLKCGRAGRRDGHPQTQMPSICFPPSSWCCPASLLWLCSLLYFWDCVSQILTHPFGSAAPCQCIWELPPILLYAVLPKMSWQTCLIKLPWTSQISGESKFVYFLRQSNITQSIEWQLKTTSGSCSIIIHP